MYDFCRKVMAASRGGWGQNKHYYFRRQQSYLARNSIFLKTKNSPVGESSTKNSVSAYMNIAEYLSKRTDVLDSM